MATGITVNVECSRAWDEMKIKHKFMYVTFRIQDDKEVVVDKRGDTSSTYSAFRDALPADDCRYAVVEVPGTTKIVFVMWTPDSASVKQKMIYASTRQAILDKVPGHAKSAQASDKSELDEPKMKKLVA